MERLKARGDDVELAGHVAIIRYIIRKVKKHLHGIHW